MWKKLTEENLRDLLELGGKADGINTQLNSPLSYASEMNRYDLAHILYDELLKEAPTNILITKPGMKVKIVLHISGCYLLYYYTVYVCTYS